MTSMSPQGIQSTTSSNSSTTTSSSGGGEAREDFVMRCTKILTVQNTAGEKSQHVTDKQQQDGEEPVQQEETLPNEEGQLEPCQRESTPPPPATTTQSLLSGYSCATAILQHSYLEMVCGRTAADALVEPDVFMTNMPSTFRAPRRIPDDPTVQDSIECVFASQLEEGQIGRAHV